MHRADVQEQYSRISERSVNSIVSGSCVCMGAASIVELNERTAQLVIRLYIEPLER